MGKGTQPQKTRRARSAGREPTVSVRPFGPTPEQLEDVAAGLGTHPEVERFLAKTRHRLLGIDVLDAPAEDTKPARPRAPDRFRATFFDYTNNRAVLATGRISQPSRLEVVESGVQPRPSEEEFAEAVRLVKRDPDMAKKLRDKSFDLYRPMPPLVGEELPDGRVERTVAVGVMPSRGMGGHEIVGVNLNKRKLVRYPRGDQGRAPAMAAAHNPICGLPNAFQGTARGVAGRVWVTVRQGGTTVWRFQVVRPAASSGTNGSGVELRYVDYRGKRVLFRAHVPILNVKYDGNACGPYRDWQDQEGMLTANGRDVGPGFRLCPTPATTILDTGSDAGNFLGVAIYVQGQEVVLVSEMEAGWYRYVSMWRLHANGTIKPRFGFSAVHNSCVCTVHHHHVYWRLDFDIRTAWNNVVREHNRIPLIGRSTWFNIPYEVRRSRSPALKRRWRVRNTSSGEAYDVIPGKDDGVATSMPDWPFPRGDLWFLRYRASEIDDGSVAIGPPYEAGLDNWVNGESLNGTDVVVWYGAHFSHDVAHDHPGQFGHIVGPDLRPVNWGA